MALQVAGGWGRLRSAWFLVVPKCSVVFIGKEWCSVTLSFTLRLLLKLIVRAIHSGD